MFKSNYSYCEYTLEMHHLMDLRMVQIWSVLCTYVHFGWKGESIHPLICWPPPRFIKFNKLCKLFPHPTHKHERLDNVEGGSINAATWINPCDCPLFHKVTCIFHLYLIVWFNLFSLECSSQPSQGHVNNSFMWFKRFEIFFSLAWNPSCFCSFFQLTFSFVLNKSK